MNVLLAPDLQVHGQAWLDLLVGDKRVFGLFCLEWAGDGCGSRVRNCSTVNPAFAIKSRNAPRATSWSWHDDVAASLTGDIPAEPFRTREQHRAAAGPGLGALDGDFHIMQVNP